MHRRIRILVANRPKLMRELILATLSDEPGIEIVGEVSDEAEIRQQRAADVAGLVGDRTGRTSQKSRHLRYLASRPARTANHRGRIAGELQRFLLGVVRHSFQPDRTVRTGDSERGAKYPPASAVQRV